MIPMTEFFIFTVVVDKIERVVMHPKHKYPLLYLKRLGIEADGIKQYLQSVADLHGVNFELKHFKLEKTLETIEPMKTRMDQ